MALQSPVLSSANPAGYQQLSWPKARTFLTKWLAHKEVQLTLLSHEEVKTVIFFCLISTFSSDIFNYWKGLTDCFANSNSILAQGPSRLVEGWTCSPVERSARVNNQPSSKPRSRVGAPWSPASSTLGCDWMLQRFWYRAHFWHSKREGSSKISPEHASSHLSQTRCQEPASIHFFATSNEAKTRVWLVNILVAREASSQGS